MIKIPKALTGCDHIEALPREIKLFRRHSLKINLHIPGIRQDLSLADLLFRDIRTDPFGSVLIHIAGEYSCPGSEIKYSLPLHA